MDERAPGSTAKCLWCGKPAVAWCDAVIGFKAIGAHRDAGGRVTSLLTGTDEHGEAVAWTCDAPMCAEHAQRIGGVCGEDPDSIDHCPYHVSRGEGTIEELVMFAREAEQKRRDVHAEIRRQRIKREANPTTAKQGIQHGLR